ncbi:MAG: hypothetical protein F4Z47_08645 [Rhodospirillaceae bacterium]|nr:hypothetical protein [Rhodospirillaceae bacterium]
MPFRGFENGQSGHGRGAEFRASGFDDRAATIFDMLEVARQVATQIAPRRFAKLGASPELRQPRKRP